MAVIKRSSTDASRSRHHPVWPPPTDVEALVDPWSLGPRQRIAFIHARILDAKKGVVLEDRTVKLSVDGLIDSVESFSAKDLDLFAKDSKWIVVDSSNYFLSPGLIDCHQHIMIGGPTNLGEGHRDASVLGSSFALKGMLARGFTTIRDVGGATKAHADATAAWQIPGPRVFQGGPVFSQSGGHGDGGSPYIPAHVPGQSMVDRVTTNSLGLVVDGVNECLQAARVVMKQGADHIKICGSGGVLSEWDGIDSTQFTKAEIEAIVGVVEDMGGTMVTSHCHSLKGIQRSIAAGVKGIEHGSHLDEATAKIMAEKGVFHTPTLIVSEIISRSPWKEQLSVRQREKAESIKLAMQKSLSISEKAGVVVCLGTDQPDVYQSQEFALRADQGISSPSIFRQATFNGAKQLGQEGRLGVIAAGAFADLLLLNSNPLDDIRCLSDPHASLALVVKDGRVVYSDISALPAEVSLE